MKVKFLLIVLIFLGNLQIQAQSVSTYTFTPSSSTFTPLVGGTAVPAIQTDDAISGAIPIGFTFFYNGTGYTDVYASSNGFLSFNPAATTTTTNDLTASAATIRPLVAPLWDDIDGNGHSASYITTGSPGSRIFTFEWLNWEWRYPANTPVISFQVKLYEATGNVEFLYQDEPGAVNLTGIGTPGASIGITGTPIGAGNFLSLDGTGTSPLASSVTETTTLSVEPATGQSYLFSPGTPPASPVSLTFTSVGPTSMTVNWVDNSTNESNFLVYRSTDGINYTLVGTVPSSSTATTGTPYNLPQSSLFSNTLYYWQVLAVDNIPSLPLSGSQSTLAGLLCGTYTIGPTGNYTSLTAAIADITVNGISCPLILELQAAYVSSVETFPLNIPGLGASSSNTITVRPESAAINLSITSGATQTINYNGGSYFIFDGRPGGLGTVSQLTLDNTSTTGNAIRLIGGSVSDTITYCNITGVNTSGTSGVIFLSTGTNTNNCFINNDIRSGATVAANLIYSSGSANSNTIIQNNNIHNFTAGGIVNTNGNAWTIGGSGLGNNIYQEAARSGAFTAINISGGNSHIVSFNSIYQTAGVNTGANNGIAITAGTGHTVNDNSIGGSNSSRTGTAMYSTAGSTSIGINIAAGTGTTTHVYNNRISNWGVSRTGTLGVANGILVSSGTVNVGTLGGNMIGGAAITGIPSDTVITSYDNGWIWISGGTVMVENNIISNASYYRNGNDRNAGIYLSAGTPTVNNNTITALKGNNTGTTGSTFITAGITVAVGGAVIDGNTISDVLNFNTAANGPHVAGINITTASSSTVVRRNHVSNIRSTGTQTGANSPIVNGIYLGSSAPSVYNNMIAVGMNNSGENRIVGIYENTTANPAASIWYNSVYVTGTTTAGANNSYAFRRGSTGAINLRNNLFYNERTGGTGNHYAIGNTAGTPATNWTATTSDNNFFATTGSTAVGEWGAGVPQTLLQFQASSSGDTNSKSDLTSVLLPTTLWIAPSTGNLKINPAYYLTPSQLESKGEVVSVTTDFEGDVRPGPAGSVNGGGTFPDIGADEFDGTPILLDVGISVLVQPFTSGCHSNNDSIIVRLHNYSTQPLDMSVNPVTITSSVTGPNPMSFPAIVINSGVLPGSGNMDTVVATGYDMTAVGTYTFNASASLTGDGSSNDAMTPVNIVISGGIASVDDNICAGSAITLVVSGNTNGGNVQWEISQDGISWTTIPGATSDSYSYADTSAGPDTLFFRSISCGMHASVYDSTIIIYSTPAITFDTSRCGPGYVDLHASGTGTLKWYDAPAGGTLLDTGMVYTPYINATDTFYIENVIGGTGVTNVGPASNSIGTGGQSTVSHYLMFDVFTNTTIQSMVIYPGATGAVTLEQRLSDGTTVVNSYTHNVTAGEVGTAVTIPVNWNVTPGTGYRLYRTGTPSLYRNDSGGSYPYTIPGVISITGNSFDVAYYYWGYNWAIISGCSAGRTPLVAAVIPSVPINAFAVGGGIICDNESDTLVVTSSNTSYSYMWSPSTGLADSTAAITAANPSVTTTYFLTAIDTANCQNFDTVTVVVNASPAINILSSDSVICYGDTATLFSNAGPFIYSDSTDVNIPDNTPAGINSPVLSVSGVASSITVNTIDRVCFNIDHTFDGDIVATLIAPSGTQILLVGDEGGTGEDFVGTCFSPTAVTVITGGAAPFTGLFIPEDPVGFAAFNGENANGNWYLHLEDNAGVDVGSLLDWSITFNPPVYTYSWSSTGGSLPDTTNTIMVNPTTTTTYYLTAIDTINGCQKTDTLTLAVYDQLQLSPYAYPPIACFPGSDTLVANATGGEGNYTFAWSDALGTNDSAIVTGLPFDYTVGVTVTDGCGIITDSLTIDIADPLSITSTDTVHCGPGTSFLLSTDVSGGNGVNNYMWTGGSTSSTYTTGMISSTTNYTVTVTDGCGTTATSISTVTIYTPPVVNLGPDIIQPNPPAILDAGSGFMSYLWNTMATTQTISVSANGTYTVTVTDANGCTDSDAIQVNFTVGINNSDGSIATVSYYPNPTNGILNMNIQGFMGEELKMEIMDMEGRIVRNFVIAEITENYISQIDLSTLKAGTYLVVLHTANDAYTHRIVITTQY